MRKKAHTMTGFCVKWRSGLKSMIYTSNYPQPFTLAISENFLLPIKKDTPENFWNNASEETLQTCLSLLYLVPLSQSYPALD